VGKGNSGSGMWHTLDCDWIHKSSSLLV